MPSWLWLKWLMGWMAAACMLRNAVPLLYAWLYAITRHAAKTASGELETQKLSSQLLWLVTDTGRTQLLPGFIHWELCNQNEIIEPCSPTVKRVLEKKKQHWKSIRLTYILESFEQASNPYVSTKLEETPSFLEEILKNLSVNPVNGYDCKLPSLH